jgi:gas vesicle protein
VTYDYDRFETESEGMGFLAGLLAGAALGVGLGMLFAPKTGSELRHQISEGANRLGHQAEDVRRAAQQKYREASESVNEMVGRGRDALQQGREAYERTRDQLADDASDISRTATEGRTSSIG